MTESILTDGNILQKRPARESWVKTALKNNGVQKLGQKLVSSLTQCPHLLLSKSLPTSLKSLYPYPNSFYLLF